MSLVVYGKHKAVITSHILSYQFHNQSQHILPSTWYLILQIKSGEPIETILQAALRFDNTLLT